MNREKFEERLRKEDDNYRRFEKYEHGRDVETFEGTREQLEENLGKTVRVIEVEGDFIEHTYKKFEVIGWLRADFLIEYQIARYKKGEPIYKGIPVAVE